MRLTKCQLDRVSKRKPRRVTGDRTGWYHHAEWHRPALDRDAGFVPREIWDLIGGRLDGGYWGGKLFATASDARAALADALARYARGES